MKYRELCKVVIGRLFDPLNEKDQKIIMKYVKEGDFLNSFTKNIFRFGRKKYESRGEVPKTKELSLQKEIALYVLNSDKEYKNQYNAGQKFDQDCVLEIINDIEDPSSQILLGIVQEKG